MRCAPRQITPCMQSSNQVYESLDVPIPAMRIQEKFHDALVSIRSILSQRDTSIDKARATFDALLAQVFSAS